MADRGEIIRRDASPSPRLGSRKARPRTAASELPAHDSGKSKKSAKRSPTAATVSNERIIRSRSPSHTPLPNDGLEKTTIEIPAASSDKMEEAGTPSILTSKDSSLSGKPDMSPPGSISVVTKLGPPNESEDSSGSCETVTHIHPMRRDSSGKGTTAKPRKPTVNKPNALSFLDSDSPQLTPEGIQRTVKTASGAPPDMATRTSPSSHSTSSTASGLREDLFDVFGDHEADQSSSPRSTSPEHSINGDIRSTATDEAWPRTKPSKSKRRSYGTPEMTRGNLQHFHPDDATPRAPNQHFIKHIRPEKPPLTGYELVASKLSATSTHRWGPPIRPIYRRFETLNHRILLHLQDEICELEDQLRHIDIADTQNRRLPNGIVPASRRAESVSGSELHWHKTDILGKIGFKLEQYNATDDLVWLGYSDEDSATNEEDIVTPISPSDITDFPPRRRVSILSQSDTSRRYEERRAPSPAQGIISQSASHEQDAANEPKLTHLSLALTAAITLPILTFLVIPGFIGRMTVVCLVGIGILGTLVQGNVMRLRASQELCISVGLYGGVMAFLAGMIN
ncbi:hypothetical protein NPX13_g9856 [Xylaria arbuscula]|uniref:DUF6594 domain-containing protein n=1 Tax=Xylaria arbuscula TaxID=114810 RepID=A0A9W8N5Y9_9PEZI|nr:hypothetical protein NPX13_g9856 [Xylaria arbuscula]